MARSYATIATSIWTSPVFKGLSREDQGSYFLLTSQPNISAAGTLPLTLRRWANTAATTTARDVRDALDRLEVAGLIAVDDDTEEVLVRPFIREDKGYGNPKRRPTILDAADEVVSQKLRRALAEEFLAVGLPTARLGVDLSKPVTPEDLHGPDASTDRLSDCLSDRCSDGDSEASRTPIEPIHEVDIKPDKPAQGANTDHTEEFSQANRLSDRQSDRESPTQRSVVTQGPYIGLIHTPQSSSLTPHSGSPSPSAASASRVIAESTGATENETREILGRIKKQHQPRNLTGYVRAMASSGDLADLLGEIRAQRDRAAAAAERRSALIVRQREEQDREEIERPVTPEQAAAAKAALRAFMAGAGPAPGEVLDGLAPIGAILKVSGS